MTSFFVTLSDSEGSEGDSSVAALPQNDKGRACAMTAEGARDDPSYCHCEAHGAEAISSLFASRLLHFAHSGSSAGTGNHPAEDALVHGVALLHGGKAAGLDLGYIVSDSFLYAISQFDIPFSVFRDEVGVKSEHVVNYLDLTIAVGPGANTDGGDG